MATVKGLVDWLLFISYSVLIFVQSSRPASDHLAQANDKLLHFAGYALLAILACRAFKSSFFKHSPPWAPLAAGALFASLYGIGDEIHQSFVPFRDASIQDAWADIAGSIFGTGVLYLLDKKESLDQK